MPVLIVTDGTGDTRTEFKSDDDAAVTAAMERFTELMNRGYIAYDPGQNGADGKRVKSFDPTREKTVMFPQRIGG